VENLVISIGQTRQSNAFIAMDIKEMQAKKAALESKISNMLLEFTRETKAKVDLIYVDVVVERDNKPVAYLVDLNLVP